MTIQTRRLARTDIAKFITDPRGIIAFEALQQDTVGQNDVLSTGTFLALSAEPSLGSERIFTPVAGELTGTDGGANLPYTLGLANTTVTPGPYGSAAKSVTVQIDAKGRITSATEYAMNTANVVEGANLYYTDARARAALSASSGVSYISATGAFKAVSAGTYGAPTGTLSRTALASYTAGTTLTFSLVYVQAELTALATRLAAVETALAATSQTLAALVTDMKTNGNLA